MFSITGGKYKMLDRDGQSKISLFSNDVSSEQVKDTGLAIALIALIIAYLKDMNQFLLAAIILIVIDMTFPFLFRPIARIWFGIANIIGSIVSRLVLTLVFFLVVTPVAILRKWMKKDSLMLKRWKRENDSVFEKRFYQYDSNDLEKPY
jgi:hypothetical protein